MLFVCSASVLCSSAGHTIRDLQPLYSLSDESSLAAEDDDDRAVMKLLDMPNQKCGRILYFQGPATERENEGQRMDEQMAERVETASWPFSHLEFGLSELLR